MYRWSVFIFFALTFSAFYSSAKEESYLVNGGFSDLGDENTETERFHFHLRFKQPLEDIFAAQNLTEDELKDEVIGAFKFLKYKSWVERHSSQKKYKLKKSRETLFNTNEYVVKEYPIYNRIPISRIKFELNYNQVKHEDVNIVFRNNENGKIGYNVIINFNEGISFRINPYDNRIVYLDIDGSRKAQFMNKSKSIVPRRINEKSCNFIFQR